MRMDKKKYGIIIAVIITLSVGLFFSIQIFGALDEEPKFDTKMQLSNYLSFDQDIVDVKKGYLDNDNNLDFVVVHEDRIEIFEEDDYELNKVGEIKVGDDGFLQDTTLTTIEIGNVFGRELAQNSNQVSDVSNSTGCNIEEPLIKNLDYLIEADNISYNLLFEAGGNANFTIDFNVAGITPTSFNLNMLMNHSTTPEEGWILIKNIESNNWESLINISEQASNEPTEIEISTTNLISPLLDYIDENGIIKVRFNYNHSSAVDVSIDYIDIVEIEMASNLDIIVGSANGDICIIQAVDNLNNYKTLRVIQKTFYDSASFPDEDNKRITSILTGDLNNDGTDEIIIGNNYAKIYAINHTETNNFEKLYLLDGGRNAVDTEGIKWELEAPSGLLPSGKYNSITSLSAIETTENGDFILYIGTREFFYVHKYINGTGFTPGGYPNAITYLETEITDLAVVNLPGSSNLELVVSTLTRNFYVYQIEGTNYLSENSYIEDWNSDDMIGSGNRVLKMTSGDYSEKDKNVLAIGSTEGLNKIQVITKDSDYDIYWKSETYIRDDVIGLDTINKEKQDSLVVITNRQIFILSNWDYEDADKDGLSDYGERVFYATDPQAADSDGDGLNDGVEVYYYETDPLNADTDADLINEGLEVVMGTDPLNPFSSIIIIILIPTVIFLAIYAAFFVIRKELKRKREDYETVKETPNLMPQIRRLIIQRLETFSKEFEGFQRKRDLNKFKRNLPIEIRTIIFDRLYNFLEYLRLRGIDFTAEQEEILKKIMINTTKPIIDDLNSTIKVLLTSETKFKNFNEEMEKTLEKYKDWKKAATRGKKGEIVVEELIKCPECESLQPKGSAFCLECGNKLKK